MQRVETPSVVELGDVNWLLHDLPGGAGVGADPALVEVIELHKILQQLL